MIEISGLTVSMDKKKILNKTSLSIEENKIIGIVAPNGTGKTTFLKTLSGLITPDAGVIKINKTSFNNDRSDYLSQLFFIEDSTFLYSDIKVVDHLKYVKNNWQSSVDIEQVIADLNMENYKNLSIKKLSLGMRQHVLIAMYIVSDASILLMDEPMNGLDPTSLDLVSGLLKKLKQEDKVVILSSHNLTNVIDICDEVMFMKDTTIEWITGESKNNLKELYDEYYVKSRGKSE